jgi:hypothetical protein
MLYTGVNKQRKEKMKQLQATNKRYMSHLKASDLKPEDYLTKFAEYCVELAIESGWGSRENLGTGFTVHISDTRGRKTLANGNRGHAIGLCWASVSSTGNHRRIEIDREESRTLRALQTVAHEVAHAVTPEGTGHKGAFVELVFNVFKLGGKPTSTIETEEFKNLIWNWLELNGTYTHKALIDTRPKQTTRMVKLACADINCVGATEKSVRNGEGTIWRMSSAVVLKSADRLTCPVCQGWDIILPEDMPQSIYK